MAIDPKDKLNERQIRFCQEYIIDLNGTQSAIRAGYSVDTAQQQSSDLLLKPLIQEYVQELLDDRASRTKATADKAISEIYHLVSFDPAEIFDDNGNIQNIRSLPKEIRKSISSLEVFEEYSGKGTKSDPKEYAGRIKKIKFWDKTKAIELLARHLKLLTDKTELIGDVGMTKIFILRGDKAESEDSNGNGKNKEREIYLDASTGQSV